MLVQDKILQILRATYSDDRLYASMELRWFNCCDEGGFFGPWYLYAIAIVNPDALGKWQLLMHMLYGDGGLGQLYPGIYKINWRFF